MIDGWMGVEGNRACQRPQRGAIEGSLIGDDLGLGSRRHNGKDFRKVALQYRDRSDEISTHEKTQGYTKLAIVQNEQDIYSTGSLGSKSSTNRRLI